MKTNLLKLACGLALLVAAFTVKAQSVINFENSQINQENLGLITTTTGGAPGFALLAGLSNGDPGNWGLEGSNGPHLLGFWGSWNGFTQGYTGPGDTEYAAIDFTVPNTTTPLAVGVSFNVLSRSDYAGGSYYTFYGFNNGNQVVADTPSFTSVIIDGYSEYEATVSFTGVDEIRFNSTEPGGLDNFIISSVPEPSTLALAGLGGLSLLQFRRRK
jgi:hypothetical protein